MKPCQAKSEAKSWDDLIEFTEAKIAELKDALKTFKRNKETGREWNLKPVTSGGHPEQPATPN